MEKEKEYKKEEKSEKNNEKEHLFLKGSIIFVLLVALISLVSLLISFIVQRVVYNNGLSETELNEIVSSFSYEESDYLSFSSSGNSKYSLVIDKNEGTLIENEKNKDNEITTYINLNENKLYIDEVLINVNESEVEKSYFAIKNNIYTNYLRFDSSLKNYIDEEKYLYDYKSRELKVTSSDYKYYLLYNEFGLLIEGSIHIDTLTTYNVSYIK